MRTSSLIVVLALAAAASADPLLPAGWDPKAAADRVMAGLVKVTGPEIKGAHDSDFATIGGKAYVVAEVNEVKGGESSQWPFIYSTMAIVDLKTLKVEKTLVIGKGGQTYGSVQLPEGACMVPRAWAINDHTIRCTLNSEDPGKRQQQVWYRDFDITTGRFEDALHRMKLKTATGVADLTPESFYNDAATHGLTRKPKDWGLFQIDAYKPIDGQLYTIINSYSVPHMALARAMPDGYEIIGHFNQPEHLLLSEAAVQKMPDGSWLAICRREGKDTNYLFVTSADGKTWSTGEPRPFVTGGANSKPTFDKFRGVYYLGWQERARINNVSRSIFNIDVSTDGQHWQRKYRFETEHSFQYPSFREHDGAIWFTVTQGDTDPSRKERIMFGRLE